MRAPFCSNSWVSLEVSSSLLYLGIIWVVRLIKVKDKNSGWRGRVVESGDGFQYD